MLLDILDSKQQNKLLLFDLRIQIAEFDIYSNRGSISRVRTPRGETSRDQQGINGRSKFLFDFVHKSNIQNGKRVKYLAPSLHWEFNMDIFEISYSVYHICFKHRRDLYLDSRWAHLRWDYPREQFSIFHSTRWKRALGESR